VLKQQAATSLRLALSSFAFVQLLIARLVVAMRASLVAASAFNILPRLRAFHRSPTCAYASPRFEARPGNTCHRSIRTSYTSTGSELLLGQRAVSSQAEQFSLGWTGNQSSSAGSSDGNNLRLQAQQVVFSMPAFASAARVTPFPIRQPHRLLSSSY
jgi:hypothetical protein